MMPSINLALRRAAGICPAPEVVGFAVVFNTGTYELPGTFLRASLGDSSGPG